MKIIDIAREIQKYFKNTKIIKTKNKVSRCKKL